MGDDVAGPDHLLRGCDCDEPIATRECHVDDLLVAHRLDDSHFPLLSVLSITAHLDVLRTNAKEYAAARFPIARNVECEIDSLERAHPQSAGGSLGALNHSFDEVHRRAADESRDEFVGGMVVELHWRRDLLQDSLLEHRDSVAQSQRFGLVVRDVHHRRAELAMEPSELDSRLDAELGVEIGQRLVEEKCQWLAHDRAAKGDALALASESCAGFRSRSSSSPSDAAIASTRVAITAGGCFLMLSPNPRFCRTVMCGYSA